MTKLENILFADGDFNEKKSYIENMVVDELMEVKESVVKSIIDKCGYNNRFWINNRLRQGNHCNSLVEFLYTRNCNVFVGIHVQNTKTDTTMIDSFDRFFRRGEYYSRDKFFVEGVDYKESDKAEVIRSILLSCIYWLFNDEAQRGGLVSKLRNYSIAYSVLDYFYKEWDLGNRTISRYSSRYCVVNNKAYYYGEKKINEYINDHLEELVGKSNEELQAIYKKVFVNAYNEFDKVFDYNKWRSECTLWH